MRPQDVPRGTFCRAKRNVFNAARVFTANKSDCLLKLYIVLYICVRLLV